MVVPGPRSAGDCPGKATTWLNVVLGHRAASARVTRRGGGAAGVPGARGLDTCGPVWLGLTTRCGAAGLPVHAATVRIPSNPHTSCLLVRTDIPMILCPACLRVSGI